MHRTGTDYSMFTSVGHVFIFLMSLDKVAINPYPQVSIRRILVNRLGARRGTGHQRLVVMFLVDSGALQEFNRFTARHVVSELRQTRLQICARPIFFGLMDHAAMTEVCQKPQFSISFESHVRAVDRNGHREKAVALSFIALRLQWEKSRSNFGSWKTGLEGAS